MLGQKSLVAKASWPKCDAFATTVDSVTVVFQVNGKLRGQAEVAPNTPQDDLLKIALENERVKPLTDGKTIVKTIFVPNKIVNIVVK
jgi:leucyl-tRNA synthetase